MDINEYFLDGCDFPIVLSPTNINFDVAEWARNSKAYLRTLLDAHGAILFRGFNIPSIKEFEMLAAACTSDNWVEYLEATSPRTHVDSHTSTSTEYNRELSIFQHNEKSYSAVWPHYLFFYCKTPPEKGGETPLADCRAIYRDVPDDIKDKFKKKKLMYVRQFAHNMGIPWKKAFNVNNREEMELYCQNNYIDKVVWKSDGTPKLSYLRDVAIEHPSTGDPCWFNHGTFFNINAMEQELREVFLAGFSEEELPYNTYFGTGDPIDPDIIHILKALYSKHSIKFPYHKNDVLFIDNMLVTHGREPYEGPREILVTMTDGIDYKDVKKI